MKKKLLKVLSVVLCAVTVIAAGLTGTGVTVQAAGKSVSLGENVTGTLSDDGKTITISGTGAMTGWVRYDSYDKDGLMPGGVSEGEHTPLFTEEEVLAIENIIIEEGITSIDSIAFACDVVTTGCLGPANAKVLQLPNTLESIHEWAFFGTAIEEVVIPDSVTSIGDRAFRALRNMTSFTIGAGLKTVERWFDMGFSSLKEIHIPVTVETIKSGAFTITDIQPHALKKIIIDSPDTVIEDGAFHFKGVKDKNATITVELITENPSALAYDWAGHGIVLKTDTDDSVPEEDTQTPPTDIVPVKPESITVINGQEVVLEVKDDMEAAKAGMTAEQQTAISEVLTTVANDTTKQKDLIKEVADKDAAEVSYSKLVDIALPAGQEIPAEGVQVTIKDANIKAGTNIVMLHMKADGTWENIPVIVMDGAITGTFTSLSPVYYFAIEEQTASAPSNGGSSNGGGYWNSSSDVAFDAADGTAMRWLTAKESPSYSISGKQTSIPAGAEFSAKMVRGETYEAVAAAVAKAKGEVSFVVYDFNLCDANGKAITKFDGHADISMPIPTSMNVPEGHTVTVYYYNNGKLEKCNTEVTDGIVTFGTTHLSTFVYVSETYASAASTPVASSNVVSPKTGEGNTSLFVMMLGMIALSGMVCVMRKGKSVN